MYAIAFKLFRPYAFEPKSNIAKDISSNGFMELNEFYELLLCNNKVKFIQTRNFWNYIIVELIHTHRFLA